MSSEYGSIARFTVLMLLAVMLCCSSLSCQAQGSTSKQTVMVPMRDGVRLATDIYMPEGQDRHPVVVIRTPYDKNAMANVGADGAKRGYVVVIQDSRGRYASEGENLPFLKDAADGYDTLEWTTCQNWCSGKIATWGGSALGITQLALTGAGTSRITCQHILVASSDAYDQLVHRGGVFRKALVEDWLKQCKFGTDALTIWKDHPTYDAFWKSTRPDLKKADYPAVHVGGWYDLFTQGTIDSFTAYSSAKAGARNKQHLVMGPWTHFLMIDNAGELTFPKGKNPPTKLCDAWEWHDCYLMGKANGIEKEPAVVYYVMGDTTDPKAPGNLWRTADSWPPKSVITPLYLNQDKTLSRKPGVAGKLSYIHDPEDPVPTIGGSQLTIPAGPMDQRKIEGRPDVLAFTSNALEKPLEVTGHVRADLWVSTDAPDADFYVRVCDVYPDGRSINICEGALRGQLRESYSKLKVMKPGQVYRLPIDLWSTSMIFNKGHKIRVHVASSCSPGYEVRGTSPAHNTVYTGKGHASCVLLPVVVN